MGRPAKPISLHLAANNPGHKSKAELEYRAKNEVKLGNKKLIMPSFLGNDAVAVEKWREVVAVYRKVDFVSSSDIGLLGRYCKTFSEYLDLLDRREKIAQIVFDIDEQSDGVEILSERYGMARAKQMFEKIEFVISLSGLLALDTAINKKMDMLLKMEDRLFLTPMSKARNIPKQEPKKVDPLALKGFHNV